MITFYGKSDGERENSFDENKIAEQTDLLRKRDGIEQERPGTTDAADELAAAKKKLSALRQYIAGYGSVAVAFSAGVDSALLLEVAHEVLGARAVAVTAKLHSVPARELEEARQFCGERGIRHIICELDELQIDGFRENPRNRCYLCKRAVFGRLLAEAGRLGACVLAEGSNMDDLGDYRPGLQAIKELGVRSPLRDVGLTKREIRLLSRELGLPTWEKPSFACLSSRFAYGETITQEKLAMVEQGERLLADLGFRQFRVRIHGTMARIEVLPEEFGRLVADGNRIRIVEGLKRAGFTYVSMDLQGYRTGSMNEAL